MVLLNSPPIGPPFFFFSTVTTTTKSTRYPCVSKKGCSNRHIASLARIWLLRGRGVVWVWGVSGEVQSPLRGILVPFRAHSQRLPQSNIGKGRAPIHPGSLSSSEGQDGKESPGPGRSSTNIRRGQKRSQLPPGSKRPLLSRAGTPDSRNPLTTSGANGRIRTDDLIITN